MALLLFFDAVSADHAVSHAAPATRVGAALTIKSCIVVSAIKRQVSPQRVTSSGGSGGFGGGLSSGSGPLLGFGVGSVGCFGRVDDMFCLVSVERICGFYSDAAPAIIGHDPAEPLHNFTVAHLWLGFRRAIMPVHDRAIREKKIVVELPDIVLDVNPVQFPNLAIVYDSPDSESHPEQADRDDSH